MIKVTGPELSCEVRENDPLLRQPFRSVDSCNHILDEDTTTSSINFLSFGLNIWSLPSSIHLISLNEENDCLHQRINETLLEQNRGTEIEVLEW